MPKSNTRHQAVRVRFAPSPTGNLHVGGARTALFNWLFARHHQGTFILRIEDTDRERSSDEYVREIIDSLEWLGLHHDEAPCFQSRRMDLYRAAADTLLDSGRAYHCFCTPEELAARRGEAADRGGVFKYDGRCSALSPLDVESRISQGEKPVLRIRVPQGVSSWEDLVRGTINFDNRQLDDFIISKSSGVPTYHFAVVVDDIDMSITHVIRGEDHISNTPKQLILYEALGSPPPLMAHIPLIHGTDGGRLSKRHGATAVLDYRKMGFLPQAMVNYLALLGWSPGDDREIMDLEKMASLFDLNKVVKTPAIFDLEKLTWMNGNYLSAMPPSTKADLVLPFLIDAGLIKPDQFEDRKDWLEKMVEVVGDRIKLLADIVPHSRFFFVERIKPDPKAAKAIEKSRSKETVFRDIADELEALDDYDRSTIEGVIRAAMDQGSLSPKQVMQPIRAAISGSTASPGLFESMELLGKKKTLQRIREHLVPSGKF